MSVMCVLAFLAFLRNGKLTIFTKVHAILTNVTQLDRLGDNQCRVQALQLPLDNYKHKANEPPFVIFIYPEKICCPVKLLLDFISVQGSVQGPLFCWPDGKPIKRAFFVEKLKAALTFCDLDISLYKAHSFRIGAASWASAKGFTDSQIRHLGRWRSNAFLRYIRTPSLGTRPPDSFS